MNRKTILTLNQINRNFYRQRADEFVETRRRPWRGWARLLERIEDQLGAPSTAPTVLDIGCGNGRFGVFLGQRLDAGFHYAGLDMSETALSECRANLSVLDSPSRFRLWLHDVVRGAPESPLPPDIGHDFTLVSVFGFLHHVPGFETRRELLQELARRLSPGGVLAVSIWQFGRFARFRKKIHPWDEFIRSTGSELDPAELETGDMLLSWGPVAGTSDPQANGGTHNELAYRYCHFVDADETSRLVAALPLAVMDVYAADGRTNDLNQYVVLRKPLESRPG